MSSILTAVLLAGILPFGGDKRAEPFPVEAHGEIRFQLDGARFRSRAGSPQVQELYLSIPQESLQPSPDSTGNARVEVELGFEDAEGDEIGRAVEDLWIPLKLPGEGDLVFRPRHLLTLRPAVPEGASQVRVRIEDLVGRKRGLLDRMRGKRPSGEARAGLSGGAGACSLSDVVFVWDVDRSEAAASYPVRLRLRPNPLRYYGLYHTTLLFYLESYGAGVELPYRILRLPGGEEVYGSIDSARAESGNPVAHLVGLDVSSLPAGMYRVEARASGADTCRSRADFQLLWEAESWTRDEKELFEEAYVLLNPMEYERVRDMPRGDVEVYMRELWSRHDPDPSSGRNELHDIYRERMGHANRFFATAIRKGMLSDRGRVYIRYGPPDEITKELNPQDQDLISQVLPAEIAPDRYDQVRGTRARNPRDDRAYEIWNYTVRGEPLFPEQEVPVQKSGLKFIFVDELGYGDMRLIYTNLSGAF